MIFMIICLLLLSILLIKTKLNIDLQNNKIRIKIIIFFVIKIEPKAKTKVISKKQSNFKLIFKIIKDSLSKFRYLLSKLSIDLKISCNFYLDSAYYTAIIYGIINAIIYNFDILLRNFAKVYKSNYIFIPDFNGKRNKLDFKITLSIRNMYILIFIIRMLPIIFKYRNQFKKGGEVNESSNRRPYENYDG